MIDHIFGCAEECMNAGMIEHKNDLTKVECNRGVIDQALVNCLDLGPWAVSGMCRCG